MTNPSTPAQREFIDNGGPAFPRVEPLGSKNQSTGEYVSHESDPYVGMYLRDYFAAKALNGSMARGGPVWGTEQERRVAYDKFAERMYAMADAMLRARKSGGAA